MVFNDLSQNARANAVQAFSDYFDDEVYQRMLESIDRLERTRFIDVDVSIDADGAFSLDAKKSATPCFADGDDMPSKPERLKPTDDTVDQLFCESYNASVKRLDSSWGYIRDTMRKFPNALSALNADERFMGAWQKDMGDYGEAVSDAVDDDDAFAELEDEFEDMNAAVKDAIDDFADDDLDATQDALDSVAGVLSNESARYRTADGVSRLSQEMGIDFDEDGEPTNLFGKTSSSSNDVEYALTRRIPAPVETQEDTGACPLCRSNAFNGRFCPVCGFHGNPGDADDKTDKDDKGTAMTLAYMLKHGSKKTARDYATVDGAFGDYGYAVIVDGNAYYCQGGDELEGTLWAIVFGDDVEPTVDFDSMPDDMVDLVREIYRVFDIATAHRRMAPGISDVLGVSVYALSKAYTHLD